MSEMTTNVEMKGNIMVRDNEREIMLISQGGDLWTLTDPDVNHLALWSNTYILPVAHHTQRNEAYVGAASHCALSKRNRDDADPVLLLFFRIE